WGAICPPCSRADLSAELRMRFLQRRGRSSSRTAGPRGRPRHAEREKGCGSQVFLPRRPVPLLVLLPSREQGEGRKTKRGKGYDVAGETVNPAPTLGIPERIIITRRANITAAEILSFLASPDVTSVQESCAGFVG